MVFEIEDFIYYVNDNGAGIHLHGNHRASDQHLEHQNSRMLGYLNQIVSERIAFGSGNLSMERVVLNPNPLDNYLHIGKDRFALVESHAFEGMG